MPQTLQPSSALARTRLACEDLPEGSETPTLVLSTGDRARLQFECLFRELARTIVKPNNRFINMLAHRCISDGSAVWLLSDPTGSYLSELASAAYYSSMIPGSPLHPSYHDFFPRCPVPIARRGSESDLSEMYRRCDCTVGEEEMRLMEDAQREEMEIMRAGSRWWDGEESGMRMRTRRTSGLKRSYGTERL